MASTFSDTLVTNILNGTSIAAAFPAGSILELYSGSQPAITAAPTGTLLATITLPATPWGTPAARAVAKNGTWQVNAVATGTIGWYRLKDASGTDADAADNTHQRIQGSVTITGSGGDMTVDNTSVASGQQVTVTGFTVSA